MTFYMNNSDLIIALLYSIDWKIGPKSYKKNVLKLHRLDINHLSIFKLPTIEVP